MFLKKFFTRKEPLLAIDLGLSSVRILEFDFQEGIPVVTNLAMGDFEAPAFSGFVIKQPDKVAEVIKKLIEANGIVHRRVALAIPAAGVFVKRIKIPKMAHKDIESNVKFEAARFLPDKLDTVKIDYHVMDEVGSSFDVLMVAARNEILDSYLTTLMMIGMEVAVVDVEYFAVQNCFELAHPDLIASPCMLVNMGARGASINLCKNGDSLIVDNMSIGGKTFTDVIVTTTGLSVEEADKLKKDPQGLRNNTKAWEAVEQKMQEVGAQINRQISLVKGAAALNSDIERIILTGGGSKVPEFTRILKETTGVDTQYLSVSRALQLSPNIDQTYFSQIEPFLGVCAGLTLRQPGDKSIA